MYSHHYVPIEGKTCSWFPYTVVAAAAILGAVVGFGFSAASAETTLYTASAVRTVPAVQAQTLRRSMPAAVAPYQAEEVEDVVFQPNQDDQVLHSTANWAMLAFMSVAAGVGFYFGTKKDTALAAVSGSRVSPLYAAKKGGAAAVVEPEAAPVLERFKGLMTPQGFYEAYELIVLVAPTLSELEKEDRLATLEALFTQFKCKKVEKIDRGRRILSYPMNGSIEAYVVIYNFKAPRAMPKAIEEWFTGPGINSDGNVLRCFLSKNSPKKVPAPREEGEGEEETPNWSV